MSTVNPKLNRTAKRLCRLERLASKYGRFALSDRDRKRLPADRETLATARPPVPDDWLAERAGPRPGYRARHSQAVSS